LCDAFQVPKPLSPQLQPFGKSDDDLGELTFEVGHFSALPVPCERSAPHEFVRCSSCSCSPLVSIRRDFEFLLDGVSDGPQQQADGPRVPGGQSACSPRTVRFLGLLLLVLCDLTDGPRRRADSPQGWRGRSAASSRTVREASADGPPLLAGRSARACVLCFLVQFHPSLLVLPRVL
jgi:hypothetical protein